MIIHYQGDLPHPAWIELDAQALAQNLAVVRAHLQPQTRVLAVVKADAYGHGMIPIAQMALNSGVDYLGIAQATEALHTRLELGEAGARVPIFAWIYSPAADLSPLLAHNIELAASSLQQLDQLAAAATKAGQAARIHLKIDTGMGRAGACPDRWDELVAAAIKLARAGTVQIVGIWSHLACSDQLDEAGRKATNAQIHAFKRAANSLDEALAAAQLPRQVIRHLAASGGVFFHPDSHFDMVRVGIGMYGLSPCPGEVSFSRLGLAPVARLYARVVQVKRVPAGTPVSYGSTWRAPTERVLALVPLGYADGIHRASVGAKLRIKGQDFPVVGRICMDQMVVDLGENPGDVQPGDVATLFGSAPDGPTADTWAEASGTINYEVLTAISARLPRLIAGSQ